MLNTLSTMTQLLIDGGAQLPGTHAHVVPLATAGRSFIVRLTLKGDIARIERIGAKDQRAASVFRYRPGKPGKPGKHEGFPGVNFFVQRYGAAKKNDKKADVYDAAKPLDPSYDKKRTKAFTTIIVAGRTLLKKLGKLPPEFEFLKDLYDTIGKLDKNTIVSDVFAQAAKQLLGGDDDMFDLLVSDAPELNKAYVCFDLEEGGTIINDALVNFAHQRLVSNEAGDYEKNTVDAFGDPANSAHFKTMVDIKLPIVGPFAMASRNSGTGGRPHLIRYNHDAFQMGLERQDLIRRACEYISDPIRVERMAAALPCSKDKSAVLLGVAYDKTTNKAVIGADAILAILDRVDKNKVAAKAAKKAAVDQEPMGEETEPAVRTGPAGYEEQVGNVLSALRGEVRDVEKDLNFRFLAIRKVDSANALPIFDYDISAGQLMSAARMWNKVQQQVSDTLWVNCGGKFKRFHPMLATPQSFHRTVNRSLARDGHNRYGKSDLEIFKFADIMTLLLDGPGVKTVARAMATRLANSYFSAAVLMAENSSKNELYDADFCMGYYPTCAAIVLHKTGEYDMATDTPLMNLDPAVILGRLVRIATDLQMLYAKHVRSSDSSKPRYPSQSVGMQYANVVCYNPDKGLHSLDVRTRMYRYWASKIEGNVRSSNDKDGDKNKKKEFDERGLIISLLRQWRELSRRYYDAPLTPADMNDHRRLLFTFGLNMRMTNADIFGSKEPEAELPE